MPGPFGSRHRPESRDDDILEVMLLGKPGCTLCDEVDELLFDLSMEFPLALLKVDITTEAELMEDYGEKIPVVRFPSGDELEAPIDGPTLRAAIEKQLRGG
jgi:thiol-disulfide isomerase/thioredoxin